MATEPAPEPVGEPEWLPVSAAARRLGVTREAVRRRVQRGTLKSRREVTGNRVRLLVRLPLAQPEAPPSAEPVGEPVADPLALLERHVADLQAEVAWLRGEVERRRWPGLWPALRRLWWGDR